MRVHKNVRFIVKLLIGLALLGILTYKIGLKELGVAFSQFNWLYTIPIAAVYGIQIILGGWRLKVIIKSLKKAIDFWTLCKYHQLSWSIALWIPGKIGEFSIIYLFKNKGIPLGKGSAVTVTEKITSLIALGLIALSGFLLFFTIKEAAVLAGILIILVVGSVAAIMNKHVRLFIRKVILRKYEKLFSGFHSTLKDYLKNYWLMFKVTVISLVKWIIASLSVYFAFLGLGVNVPFWIVVVITAMTIIISLIPISISGLGLRESAAVVLYSRLGVEAPAVLVSQIILLGFSYGIGIITVWVFFNEFIKSKSEVKI